MPTPGRCHHNTIRGLPDFLERKCFDGSNLLLVSAWEWSNSACRTHRVIFSLYSKERDFNSKKRVNGRSITIVGALCGVTPWSTLQSPDANWQVRSRLEIISYSVAAHRSNSCRYLVLRTASISTRGFLETSSTWLMTLTVSRPAASPDIRRMAYCSKSRFMFDPITLL